MYIRNPFLQRTSIYMSFIRYILQYPNRFRHRLGFGVQSPWAYQFVRDALFEKSRYYAFDHLQGSRADEQLFRIIQWLSPSHVDEYAASAITHQYITLANVSASPSAFHLHYFGADAQTELSELLHEKNTDFSSQDCLVIDGIHSTHRSVWEQLLQHPQVTSTFSLRKRGIAFFDPARQHQNYLL